MVSLAIISGIYVDDTLQNQTDMGYLLSFVSILLFCVMGMVIFWGPVTVAVAFAKPWDIYLTNRPFL